RRGPHGRVCPPLLRRDDQCCLHHRRGPHSSRRLAARRRLVRFRPPARRGTRGVHEMAGRPLCRNGRLAMNFGSFEFAVFLVVVYVLHWSCRNAATRRLLLTIASYIFYAVWNWRFCFLMLFVTANAFAAGQMLARTARPWRTAVLAASIGIDLATLG